jgi:hypothetical protein
VPGLPESEDSLLLRTAFDRDDSWGRLRAAVTAPVQVGYPSGSVEEFQAYLTIIEDRAYEGLDAADLVAEGFDPGEHAYVFLVDELALTHPEQPILVVDLEDQPGATFRVIPTEMWSVENNLSIANMGFDEFAEHVDADGIFRGFGD